MSFKHSCLSAINGTPILRSTRRSWKTIERRVVLEGISLAMMVHSGFTQVQAPRWVKALCPAYNVYLLMEELQGCRSNLWINRLRVCWNGIVIKRDILPLI